MGRYHPRALHICELRAMTGPTSASTRALERAALNAARGRSLLQDLLTELAIVLVPRGVTPKQFSALTKHAFARAAAAASQFRNGRVNQSKVAILTGLRRAEVRKLLTARSTIAKRGNSSQSAIETVLTGWCTDHRFVGQDGTPKSLSVAKGSVSFARLVKRYGGDLPHRAVLDELCRLGVARVVGNRIRIHSLSALRTRSNFTSLSQVMPLLLDVVRLISQPKSLNDASSVHRLILPAKTAVDLRLIRKRCASSIKSMLIGLNESLSERVTLPQTSQKRKHACSITVVVVEKHADIHYRASANPRAISPGTYRVPNKEAE